MWLRSWARAAAECLAPAVCVACDELVGREVFCDACAATLPQATPGAQQGDPLPVLAARAYAGAMRQAVQRFKYGGRADLAGPLGRLLTARLETPLERTLLIPVPLHPRRLTERGYNPAGLLTSAIPRVRVAHLALRRRTLELSQVAKGAGERRALHDAFDVASVPRTAGLHVLLVDDVYTTGSTARACHEALARRGVAVQGVLVLARAGRRFLADAEGTAGYCGGGQRVGSSGRMEVGGA